MIIYGYFFKNHLRLLSVTLNYLWLFYVFLIVLSYFILSYFWLCEVIIGYFLLLKIISHYFIIGFLKLYYHRLFVTIILVAIVAYSINGY
jgi:hypothetical protein